MSSDDVQGTFCVREAFHKEDNNFLLFMLDHNGEVCDFESTPALFYSSVSPLSDNEVKSFDCYSDALKAELFVRETFDNDHFHRIEQLINGIWIPVDVIVQLYELLEL